VITVNALHVTIFNPVNGGIVVDVIISSAHADIHCAEPDPVSKDFITGGGWIVGPSGAKANFGVAGGIKGNGLWGHLTYLDHGSGLKVKGTGVTAYLVVGDAASRTRRIKGTCEINGQPGFTYDVTLTDNGEPGSEDVLQLTLSNGYSSGGDLGGTYNGGGNLKLHN
jgi:hypothetical protein